MRSSAVVIMGLYNSHSAKNVKSQKANGLFAFDSGRLRRMARRVSRVPRTEDGRFLLVLRLALGFPVQADFADEIGLANNTYSPYENGSRTVPVRLWGAIEAKFKLPIEYLMHRVDDRVTARFLRTMAAVDAQIPAAGSGESIPPPEEIIRTSRI